MKGKEIGRFIGGFCRGWGKGRGRRADWGMRGTVGEVVGRRVDCEEESAIYRFLCLFCDPVGQKRVREIA